MKHMTMIGLPAVYIKRIRVSDDMAIQLAPSLSRLCRQRDTFARMAFGYKLKYTDGNPGSLLWLLLFREAEALIENLAPDFSI